MKHDIRILTLVFLLIWALAWSSAGRTSPSHRRKKLT